jgi:Multicopper oxidase
MSPTRRDLLKIALLSGATAALPVGRATAKLSERLLQQAVDSPPVLQPTRSTATTDFYDITQQLASVQILPGLGPTTMWTYNGLVPGPTIIQRQGRDVRSASTTPSRSRSAPTCTAATSRPTATGTRWTLIPPDGSQEYFYPGLHAPANLRYHDHAVHQTGRNVYMGLLAVALLVRPSAAVSRLVVGVSLATVALWLVSRTVGLPFGPAPGVEPFGPADSIASLLELLTAAALLGPVAVPAATPRSASDYRRAALLLATVAAVTVLGVTKAPPATPGTPTRPPASEPPRSSAAGPVSSRT